jgi:hypothetical protein
MFGIVSFFFTFSSNNLKIKIVVTTILHVVLYDCETFVSLVGEEHVLRVFENRLLGKIFGTKREEVTGE